MFAWKFPTMQKYRLYLSRLQKEKENESKSSFSGMKHSDVSPQDPPGSFRLHNSSTIHQTDVNRSYIFSGNSLLPKTRSVDLTSSHENDPKSIISEPAMDQPKRPPVNLPDSHKNKSSQIGFNHSFQPLESEVDFAAFSSSIPTKPYWGEVPDIQLRQEHKPFIQLDESFTKLPLPDPLSHVNADTLQSIPSTAERGISSPRKSKPPCPDYGSNHIGRQSPKVSILDSFPLSCKSHMVNHHQVLEPLTTQPSRADMDINVLNLGSRPSSLASFEDDLQVLFQDDYVYGDPYPLGVQNIEFSDFIDAGLINEIPFHLYDSVRFGYGYPCDPTEYAIIDQAY